MLILARNLQVKFQKVDTGCVGVAAGFTLIEMMIVVALLGILAALAIPSYRIWIENTKIRTATESIQTGIQKARVEAIKRNVQVSFVLGANSAWTVSCVTAAQCPDLTGGLVERRAASEGSSANISVTPTPAGADTIIFTNLGMVLSNPPAPTAPFTQLDVDNTATLSATDSRDLSIRLSTGGISRMCDPYTGLSTSDPRRC